MLNKLVLLFLITSCATHKSDPLKNTKKLVSEGHASLYQNGAFQVPATKIKLIPPGPDAFSFAKELTGLKAKESFFKYINEVKATTVTIYEGGKKTYKFSKEVDREISESLSSIAPKLKSDSIVILNSSFATSKHIVGKSWDYSKEVYGDVKNAGKEINTSLSTAEFSQGEYDGWKDFIQGYVELPEKLDRRKQKISKSLTLGEFADNFKESNEFREKASGATTYLISDSFKNYAEDINDSLSRAGQGEANEFGYTFAILRSLRWVVDGIVWQGVIKPFGKLTAGAIGYTLANGLVYPVYVVTKTGVTSTQIAVEVIRHTGSGTIELMAPTAELALSSLLYSGSYLANKTLESSARASGFIIGNSLEYIGAPIASSVVATSGAVGGVAVGIGGSVLAGATRLSGDVLGLSSNLISKTAAATTFTGGIAMYTLKGVGEAAYEISKAAVVPPSMVLGSGLTLSYGTVSQLAAHSVLAVSDAAYLVLSMEGPSWVIYAVQGKLGKGDLPANTVVDLEKLQSEGEVIRKVPVDQKELMNIMENSELRR